jgi:hypothetical protein
MINPKIYTAISFVLFGVWLQPPPLVGHWFAGTDKNKVWVDFNKDGSFKVYTPTSTENEGHFTVTTNTVSLYDKNCGTDVPGRYLLKFYSKDSVSFSLIDDPCKERSGEVNGGAMKRIP